MNVSNDGKNFNLASKPLNLFLTFGRTQFGWQIVDSIVAISSFPDWPEFLACVMGERKSNQKAAAWIGGTISINRNVSCGWKPKAVIAAQLVDPIIPLEPVPDDQAAITFLKFTDKRNGTEKIEKFIIKRMKRMQFVPFNVQQLLVKLCWIW